MFISQLAWCCLSISAVCTRWPSRNTFCCWGLLLTGGWQKQWFTGISSAMKSRTKLSVNDCSLKCSVLFILQKDWLLAGGSDECYCPNLCVWCFILVPCCAYFTLVAPSLLSNGIYLLPGLVSGRSLVDLKACRQQREFAKGETVDGHNPFGPLNETMVETIAFVGICRGIRALQGFCRWNRISSIQSMRAVSVDDRQSGLFGPRLETRSGSIISTVSDLRVIPLEGRGRV